MHELPQLSQRQTPGLSINGITRDLLVKANPLDRMETNLLHNLFCEDDAANAYIEDKPCDAQPMIISSPPGTKAVVTNTCGIPLLGTVVFNRPS